MREVRFAQHVSVPKTQLTKLAFGRSFRYFIKVKDIDVRISKDLYLHIKRIVEDV